MTVNAFRNDLRGILCCQAGCKNVFSQNTFWQRWPTGCVPEGLPAWNADVSGKGKWVSSTGPHQPHWSASEQGTQLPGTAEVLSGQQISLVLGSYQVQNVCNYVNAQSWESDVPTEKHWCQVNLPWINKGRRLRLTIPSFMEVLHAGLFTVLLEHPQGF